MISLSDKSFTNLTIPYLKQCLSFADRTSLHSPVLKVTCPGLRSNLRQLCSQLPTHSNVLKPSFEVNTQTNHLEAITYVDGDGGYITTDFVPGLLDYVQQLDCPIPFHNIDVGNRSHTLVEFREAFHDAVELSHEYRFRGPSSLQVPAGLKALASARRSVGLSKKTTIVVHGTDESGLRLLVEVVTELDTDTVPVANGLRCIREGYSYAATYNQSQIPQCYQQAEDDARSNCRGLWQLKEYHSILQKEEYKPWTLKRHLRTRNEGSGYGHVGEEFEDEDGVCYNFSVKVSTEHLNEANLYVAQSTIENAGLGLFLLPPRPGARTKVIPADTSLCIYAHLIGPEETDESHGDYYVFRDGGSYDAKVIDGENHGRFANQGGLDEGTKKMCQLAALPVGVFNWREVNTEVEQKVDAVFQTADRKKTLKLVTTKVITMPAGSSVCKEVFVDYDLKGYWIPYILRNMDAIGRDHWMVKRTLWLLLSNKSSQARTTWARGLLREYQIESDMDIVDKYSDADCPVSPPPSRRTRSTH